MQPTLFTTEPPNRPDLTASYRPAIRYENARESLFGEYTGDYETAKKSNHSSREIPQQVIDDLEAGKVSSADIAQIATTHPVYRYKTCLTIHGTWPKVQRYRIGGYKNIRQNANGSLEVYWNAIDLANKQYIAERLDAIDHPMRFHMDSRGTSFRQTRRIETKEQWEQTIAEYKETIARVKAVGARLKCDILRIAAYGSIVLELSITVLSVTDTEMGPLMYAIAGIQPEEFQTQVRKAIEAREQARAEQLKKEAEYDKQAAIEREHRAIVAQASRQRIEHLEKYDGQGLKPGVTYVLASTARNYGEEPLFRAEYKLVRYAGAGAFKRIKVVTTTVLDPFAIDGARWTDSKQMNAEAVERLMRGDWRVIPI